MDQPDPKKPFDDKLLYIARISTAFAMCLTALLALVDKLLDFSF